MNKIVAWILVVSGAMGILGNIAHVICNDFGLCESGIVSGPYIALLGFKIDCFTWWGKCIHLVIDIALISSGLGNLTNLKRESPSKVQGK